MSATKMEQMAVELSVKTGRSIEECRAGIRALLIEMGRALNVPGTAAYAKRAS